MLRAGRAADIVRPAPAQRGRDLIRTDESMPVVAVDDERINLGVAGGWDMQAVAERSSWCVRADRYEQSGATADQVSCEAVVHWMYATVDPRRPWRGLSPVEWAHETGRLGASIEKMLADESRRPCRHRDPHPAGPARTDRQGRRRQGPLRHAQGRHPRPARLGVTGTGGERQAGTVRRLRARVRTVTTETLPRDPGGDYVDPLQGAATEIVLLEPAPDLDRRVEVRLPGHTEWRRASEWRESAGSVTIILG